MDGVMHKTDLLRFFIKYDEILARLQSSSSVWDTVCIPRLICRTECNSLDKF